MLKALELAGFKSFADKTRFDFPEGITVVVGPNGSGKSNIVDAIKWVLGTQSAKSLRGDDMADVIFKGSAAGGRKPSNSAEATLILDNSKKTLDIDSDEIHVTRRVYRSGESEYLINRQPCRLKDVKDLFRGSGVGVDAYSLIEQGKVDRMLQASAKDRRAIFEEAAGISRFKAKKVETERRLARVDQNLIRLKDIVDEVHGRLSNLKGQATKAAQYREMTQRLTQVRWQSGVMKHRSLVQQSEKLLRDATELQQSIPILQEQTASAKEEVDQLESQINTKQQSLQVHQQDFQVQRERIASLESSRLAFQGRLVELAAEKELVETRLTALEQRVELTAEQIAERRTEVSRLNEERSEQSQRVMALEKSRDELDDAIQVHGADIAANRNSLLLNAKNTHQLQSTLAIDMGKRDQLDDSIVEQQQSLETIDSNLTSLIATIEQSQSHLESIQQAANSAESNYLEAQSALDLIQSQLSTAQEKAIGDQGRLHGTRERLLLLQQLEEQQEGVGRGAKRLLELAKEQPHSPWNSVQGLVADLIEIDIHLAPLIDVALGQTAETVVLSDGSIIDLVRDGAIQLGGRISMLRVDRLPSRRSGERIQLDGLRGVLGRADRLVHTKPEHASLVQYLLGNTWLVDTLATALDLSHLRGAGLRFVTAECERIDADGTVSIGSLQTALGLVSRRSEMQSAREQIDLLEQAIIENTTQLSNVQAAVVSQQVVLKQRHDSARELTQQLSNAVAKLASDKSLLEQTQSSKTTVSESLQATILRKQAIEVSIGETTVAIEQRERDAESIQTSIDAVQSIIETLQSDRNRLLENITNERIQLAKLDQRLEGLQASLDQLSRDATERKQSVADAIQSIQSLADRILLTRQQDAAAESEANSLSILCQETNQKLDLIKNEIETIRVERTLCVKRLDQSQRQVDKAIERDELLKQELSRSSEAIEALFKQFLSEYQIDLADQETVASITIDASAESLESELNALRSKIAAVGDVNMEALAELDSLQGRYDVLHEHYTDLITSKENLLKIIEKINNDSKRLFSETLDAIRTNFQTLYRRSFGGGFADLVLEVGDDVMEAGVEIVATPPGKTALSNSLLSGGEKALTAVALIMAIFQFKPSPFCILDEVDAPFDEANIGRFVAVLTDFLHMTKFVVVSHSKKTMTAANTIYGVTMQESGVSRQVAVRFEEVDDEGNIRKAA